MIYKLVGSHPGVEDVNPERSIPRSLLLSSATVSKLSLKQKSTVVFQGCPYMW